MPPDIRATYRLQLHAGFTFYDVAEIAPYLASLGISHAYCSPYLQAGAGSTHGYDVLDHTRLNSELGGAQGFEVMVGALSAAGLSHIVDIVPNHMAISSRRNRWWWDVLKNGRLSRYATYFDIDWEPPEPKLVDVILMPILGDHYGRVLARGEITVERDEDELVVRYFDHVLPLSPTSVRDVIEIEGSVDDTLARLNDDPDALHELLDAQHYRLAYWRTAGDELDYRRFFDINTLVALRQEEPEVFDATHELILDLVRQGSVEGIRVDHIDGLREPRSYLERLRDAVEDAFIVVEKILEPHEKLPEAWPIEGTTGYDFLNEALRLFVAADGEAALDDVYRSFTGRNESFEDVALGTKTLVTHDLLASDLERLTGLFIEVCEDNRDYRDFTRRELRECLRATLAAFPVYRTYVEPDGKGATEQDRMWIERAITSARSVRADLDPDLFELLHAVLLGNVEGRAGSELLLRFQQLSGPVMAKGVEDTAFYNFNRFVAVNEVGGDPSFFAAPIDDFHERCALRSRGRTRSMLATSTHDTKRSEDVRARLCVLSEIPDKWTSSVTRWSEMILPYRSTGGHPDDNAIYLFLQALVGAWPLTVERASAYMEKATKEAKSRTSWIDPDHDYDDAMRSFVSRCFDDAAFLNEVESFVSAIVDAGYVNSLAQTLVKLTAPGTPDIYQGCELWDFSLVDPDNRRPVDYATRHRLLQRVSSMTASEAWRDRHSGAPKMLVTATALRVIADHRDAFIDGSYQPVHTESEHVVGFIRGARVATIVPRLWMSIEDELHDNIEVPLPGTWQNAFDGSRVTDVARASDLWRDLPVALLVKEG